MTTITKERVAEFIKNPLDNGLTRGEQMELARIALASLEAPSLPDETVDHRDAFEAVFPIPLHVERCGAGYCCTAYNAWDAHKFVNRWEGWKACHAAMQSKAESSESLSTIQTAPALDSAPEIAVSVSSEFQAVTGCSCRTCRPVTIPDMRFVVCPDCGNKRCPHANDHRNACTGSNEPGQEGSAYPAAQQQEVK